MGHGVAQQRHVQFLRHLFHDGGLADTRRAYEEHRALPLDGDNIVAQLILGKIRRHGVLDLLFGLFDVHVDALPLRFFVSCSIFASTP